MTNPTPGRSEVILVAVHLDASAAPGAPTLTRPQAHAIVERMMAAGVRDHAHQLRDYPIEVSWWVAEDDRTDGSDNDSAVFVPFDTQADAVRCLAHYLPTFDPDHLDDVSLAYEGDVDAQFHPYGPDGRAR
jgi:hypothetical protein